MRDASTAERMVTAHLIHSGETFAERFLESVVVMILVVIFTDAGVSSVAAMGVETSEVVERGALRIP